MAAQDSVGSKLHAITEFFRPNARNSFALFAAGVALWLMVHYDFITRDAVELAIGYVTAFGLFVWLAFLAGGCIQAVRRWQDLKTARKVAAIRAAAARERSTAALDEAKQRAEGERDRAISNLGQLRQAERETVAWMHHRQQFRIRARPYWDEIRSLVRMDFLQEEDDPDAGRAAPGDDRFYVMPDHIREVVQEALGAPREDSVPPEAPWWTRNRIMSG